MDYFPAEFICKVPYTFSVMDGIETMVSRKRKDLSIDSPLCPAKVLALDPQYLHNLLPLDSTIPDPTAPHDISMSSEGCYSPEVSSSPVSSPFMDFHASRNITASFMASMSHCSSSSKVGILFFIDV